MRQRSAFTLIELIISTAVILMMLAVSLPSFVDFQRRQNVITAAHLIRDAVLDAQNYALAPRGAEAGQEGKPAGADLYRLILTNGTAGPGFRIDEQSNSDAFNPTWRQEAVRVGSLPFGVEYCSASPVQMITTSADPTTDRLSGLFYSVSQQGKIVRPTNVGSVTVVLKHRGVAEFQQVVIGIETGRVDVEPVTTAVTCT